MTLTADTENVTAMLVAGRWHAVKRGSYQAVSRPDGSQWVSVEERTRRRHDRPAPARRLLVAADAVQAIRTAA
jgi:hypothetical protein